MDVSQLVAICSDLMAHAGKLERLHDSNADTRFDSAIDVSMFSTDSLETTDEILATRRSLSGTVNRLQSFLATPSYFIQQLATQNQLLACVKWLGEFQVIAFLPLSGSISIEGLADLADVPEPILSRVVRMTATAGFLQEPQSGFVAHTSLSASFMTELSYFDAIMFLAKNVAPSALELTSVQQKLDQRGQPSFRKHVIRSSASALDSEPSFASACADNPRLSRQWSAYQNSTSIPDDSLESLLSQLNWQSLGESTIVHVSAKSTQAYKAFLQISPSLKVIIQTYEFIPLNLHMATVGRSEAEQLSAHRFTIQGRNPRSPQAVKDASMYILQPCLSPLSADGCISYELLTAELEHHFNVLQANQSAVLIVSPTLLPEPGSVAVDVEAQARLRDFTSRQLENKSALEVTELFKLVESVCDRFGRLIVTNRLRSDTGATIALVVKYQSVSDAT